MDEEEAYDDEQYDEEGNEDYDENQMGDEGDEGGEDDIELEGEGEEQMEPATKRAALSPAAAVSKQDDLDTLFKNALQSSDSMPRLLRALGPDQKQLANATISDISAARTLVSSNASQAFEKYTEALDLFKQFIGKCNTSFEQSIKVVMNEARKLSRRQQDWQQATEKLFVVAREFTAKFRSASSQAVCLCLSARLGSSNIGSMKVMLELRVERTQANKVTIAFFRGRLAAIEGRTDHAANHFLEAYKAIPQSLCAKDPKASRNKRRALELLVPFFLMAGRIPNRTALEQFGLWKHYDRLVYHAKAGDVKSLNEEMDSQEAYFSRLGCASLLRVRLSAVARQHAVRLMVRELGPKLDVSMLSRLSCFRPNRSKQDSAEARLDNTICVLADLVSRGLLIAELDDKLILHVKDGNAFPTLRNTMPRSFKLSQW